MSETVAINMRVPPKPGLSPWSPWSRHTLSRDSSALADITGTGHDESFSSAREVRSRLSRKKDYLFFVANFRLSVGWITLALRRLIGLKGLCRLLCKCTNGSKTKKIWICQICRTTTLRKKKWRRKISQYGWTKLLEIFHSHDPNALKVLMGMEQQSKEKDLFYRTSYYSTNLSLSRMSVDNRASFSTLCYGLHHLLQLSSCIDN